MLSIKHHKFFEKEGQAKTYIEKCISAGVTFLIILTFLFSIGSRLAQADITTGLFGYWLFDDGSGATAADQSGNGRTMTLNNSPTWTTGRVGQALLFDQTNDSGQVDLPVVNTFTYSLWVKALDSGDDSQYIIAQKNDGGHPYHAIFYKPSNNTINVRGSDEDVDAGKYSAIIDTNTWVHIAFVNNWSTGSTSKLYINGVATTTGTSSNFSLPSADLLFIGEATFSPWARDFNGSIDMLRVYSRALSDSDIAEIYTAENITLNSPTVSVQAASLVTATTTTLNGTITDTGNANPTIKGFQYGTTTSYGLSTSTTGSYSTGAYSMTVQNLLCNTTYHVRAYATNSVGTGNSSDTTFTTSACPTTWYVSSTGSSTNNGSLQYPWSLIWALQGASTTASVIQPGDTVYLRGGTYRFATTSSEYTYTSTLTGTSVSPITVKSFPGEWAVLDGTMNGVTVKNHTMIVINGDYTWYRDFEMTNSETGNRIVDVSGSSNIDGRRGNSIDDYGDGNKIINLIIHDTGQGIGSWMQGRDGEYYGNLIFNNGWDAPDRGNGHAVYMQHGSGYTKVQNNIHWNQFGVNLRTGGTDDSAVRGFRFEGNLFFNGGMAMEGPNISDMKLFNNHIYNNTFSVGYEPNNVTYRDAEVKRNYFTERVQLYDFFSGLIFKYNTIIDNDYTVGGRRTLVAWNPNYLTTDYNTIYNTNATTSPYWAFTASGGTDYAFNATQGNQVNTYSYLGCCSWQADLGLDLNSTFYDALKTPTSNVIYYRKNKYNPNIMSAFVYNWASSSSVSIDPSLVLGNGDSYEIHSVQDYFDDVTTGTYSGSPISVSMMGRSFERPIGYSGVVSWYHDPLDLGVTTFPTFGAFVIKNTTGTTDVASPVISNVTNDTIGTSTATIWWETNEDSTTIFDYGLTTSYGSSSTTDDGTLYGTFYTTFHEISLRGLSPGTTYHYRLTDVDYTGNSRVSGDYTFLTSVATSTVVTSAASAVSASTATLNGSISATGGGDASQSGFAYGTSATLATVIATSTLGSQTGTASFSTDLTGLSCATTYYARSYATNSVGTGYGTIVSFATSACSESSGGGGGGGGSSSGGGSSFSNTSVSITTTLTSPLASSSPIFTIKSDCLMYAYPSFSQNLARGASGPDVVLIQKVLAIEGLFNVNTVPTYGTFTETAMGLFQKKYGIVSTTDTKGLGSFGPKTRTYVNSLLMQGKYPALGTCIKYSTTTAKSSTISATPITQVTKVASGTKYTFTRSIIKGSRGEDVRQLQIFLNTHGYPVAYTGIGSIGRETTLFGPATVAALIRFQEAYASEILTPSGLTSGTGFFGPATMRKVNSLK